ncbi:GDP-fucose synthetase [Candidatus Peregrinibacteria bacterium CG10_big_fil_rev_8_21_14_0_10_42_8]|nr:MAG: GDP-fucose synthetase [Candidatus Peregrinibacteria bacterium CG10_big_fil_rev_8_21_14_0_10_42_8]
MSKRILITGGHGFLGTYLIEHLQEKYSSDYTLIIPSHEDCDIRVQVDVEKLFQNSKPDMVVHLAAKVGGIGENRSFPGQLFYDNAMMGMILMESARKYGVEKYITIGTVCSYPSHTPIPFKEDALWDGYPEPTNAPYGIAKKMLLTQARAYEQEYGFHSNYLILTNLYGPKDSIDLQSSHVVPALIRKFCDAVEEGKREVVLWGDGTPTRDLLYVTDAVEGIVSTMQNSIPLMPINIGSGQDVSIAHLATMIAAISGYNGDITWDTTYSNGQMNRRVDTSLAKEYLDFQAKMPLQEGLESTVAWYKKEKLPTSVIV